MKFLLFLSLLAATPAYAHPDEGGEYWGLIIYNENWSQAYNGWWKNEDECRSTGRAAIAQYGDEPKLRYKCFRLRGAP